MQPLETKMVKAQMVSGVEGWSTSWAVKVVGGRVMLKRRTLGDKTLKARFGAGEVGPLFDFLADEGVV